MGDGRARLPPDQCHTPRFLLVVVNKNNTVVRYKIDTTTLHAKQDKVQGRITRDACHGPWRCVTRYKLLLGQRVDVEIILVVQAQQAIGTEM